MACDAATWWNRLGSPMTHRPEHDFFVAHAHLDAPPAEDLTRRLRERGCKVVLDQDLLAGDDWHSTLVTRQQACWITLALTSTRSAGAVYWKEEVANAERLAQHGPHRLIPVFLDPESALNPPRPVSAAHGLSL